MQSCTVKTGTNRPLRLVSENPSLTAPSLLRAHRLAQSAVEGADKFRTNVTDFKMGFPTTCTQQPLAAREHGLGTAMNVTRMASEWSFVQLSENPEWEWKTNSGSEGNGKSHLSSVQQRRQNSYRPPDGG